VLQSLVLIHNDEHGTPGRTPPACILSAILEAIIGDYGPQFVRSEVAAWEQSRNNSNSSINWYFTTDNARIKLRRLYPVSTNAWSITRQCR